MFSEQYILFPTSIIRLSPTAEGFISSLSTISQFLLVYKAFTDDACITNKLKLDFSSQSCYHYDSRIHGHQILSFSVVKNFIILYGGYAEAVAIDIESKFSETGVGIATICDFRNFTHGRFVSYSLNPKDTIIVLLRTPRERPFTEKLFNSKEHRSDKWVFPECMLIVTVDTDFDASLATIDLLIKSNVLFSDIASSKNIEPISPRQVTGYSIDKRVPRGLEFDGLENLSLNNSFHNATTSVSKQGRTISTINYDPKKSVEQNAKSNGVSVDTIRLYIKRNKIDRTLDDTIYI